MQHKIILFILSCIILTSAFVISILAGLFFFKQYGIFRGANVSYYYENQLRPNMWIKDPLIGYKNKPHYKNKLLGGIVVETENFGFRSEKDISIYKKSGVVRIFGIGDSVIWGTRVNRRDSFLGMLESLSRNSHRHVIEVINGGVVGYSTYQERLFFETYVIQYKPDIVLINFCNNDWLPSEDPFNNIRYVYLNYLKSLLNSETSQLSGKEIEAVGDLESLLRDNAAVWPALGRLIQNKEKKAILRYICIELPILEMHALAKKNNIRLIYLFLTRGSLEYSIKSFFDAHSIEYIDLSGLLQEDIREDIKIKKSTGEGTLTFAKICSICYKLSHLSKLLDILSLRALDPATTLSNLRRLNAFNYINSRKNFIDFYHPTQKGNLKIANYIYNYLFLTWLPGLTEGWRWRF